MKLLSARVWTAATTVLVLMSATQAPSETAVYASGGGRNGNLSGIRILDPATAASIGLFDYADVYFYDGGLAYDSGADVFYVTGAWVSSPGTSRLFSIARTTGALMEIGPVGANVNVSGGGLAIHPATGVLYATGTNGFQSVGLFTLDETTGAATLIGQTGGQCCTPPFGYNLNGLGFASDGTLYANGSTLSGFASSLYTIDLVSGAATLVGFHGVSANRALMYSGLAPQANGTFLSLGSISGSEQGLYSVEPATGAATLIGRTANFGVDGGLTVPEPAPGVVLASGFLLLRGLTRAPSRRGQSRRGDGTLRAPARP